MVLVLFVDLTYMTVFDMGMDGTSHTSPVQFGMIRFFKSGVSRMLQVVVVPTNCMVLKSYRKYNFTIFA